MDQWTATLTSKNCFVPIDAERGSMIVIDGAALGMVRKENANDLEQVHARTLLVYHQDGQEFVIGALALCMPSVSVNFTCRGAGGVLEMRPSSDVAALMKLRVHLWGKEIYDLGDDYDDDEEDEDDEEEESSDEDGDSEEESSSDDSEKSDSDSDEESSESSSYDSSETSDSSSGSSESRSSSSESSAVEFFEYPFPAYRPAAFAARSKISRKLKKQKSRKLRRQEEEDDLDDFLYVPSDRSTYYDEIDDEDFEEQAVPDRLPRMVLVQSRDSAGKKRSAAYAFADEDDEFQPAPAPYPFYRPAAETANRRISKKLKKRKQRKEDHDDEDEYYDMLESIYGLQSDEEEDSQETETESSDSSDDDDSSSDSTDDSEDE